MQKLRAVRQRLLHELVPDPHAVDGPEGEVTRQGRPSGRSDGEPA